VHSTQSLLGNALLQQTRYSEAESLLILGYEGLKTRVGQSQQSDRHRVAESGERIVRLYAIWGQPCKAAEWQKKLAGSAKAESGL
jgi:eukaryotic-like serine/threonine-protein kinase